MNVTCPSCSTVFTLPDDKRPAPGVKMRCKVCSNIFQWDGAGAKSPGTARKRIVLVANDDAAVRNAFADVLKGTSVEMLGAADGVEALNFAETRKPDVAILDVALSKLYGFEVCSMIKDNPSLSHTKVILMTSVYDKTKYKRNPASLYGADEYVERHHLHDMLIPKLESLFGHSITGATAVAEPPKSYEEDKYAEQLQGSTAVVEGVGAEADIKAKRLARIIVSDIALYNAEVIEGGIRDGNLFELIKEDIKDGIKYFRKRIDKSYSAESYLKEAFGEFVAAKKKEMGIGQ